MSLHARLALITVGIPLIAFGLTLALDFRGLTSRHSRRSVEMMWWLIGGDAEAKQRRIEQQAIMERVIGACFALGGLAAVLNALLRW